MKKLLFVALTAASLLSVAACSKESTEPLVDSEHTVCVAGNNEVLVDGEWVENIWEISADETNIMTATSVAAIKELDKTVGKAFGKKKLKSLYSIDVRLGVAKAGFTVNFMKDGKVYSTNGSYAVKAIYGHKDEETGQYISDQWVPDPHTAYCESLSPSTLFFPTWQEEKDENGFEWSQNPVCIGGAGIYTFVVGQYKNVSATGKPGFGAALILKEKVDGGQEYTEVKKFADRTWGVIGSMAESDWKTDIAMTRADDGKSFSVTLDLAADVQFKVRADAAWGTVCDSKSVETELTSAFDLTGENIKVVTAGTYKLTVTEALKLVITSGK